MEGRADGCNVRREPEVDSEAKPEDQRFGASWDKGSEGKNGRQAAGASWRSGRKIQLEDARFDEELRLVRREAGGGGRRRKLEADSEGKPEDTDKGASRKSGIGRGSRRMQGSAEVGSWPLASPKDWWPTQVGSGSQAQPEDATPREAGRWSTGKPHD